MRWVASLPPITVASLSSAAWNISAAIHDAPHSGRLGNAGAHIRNRRKELEQDYGRSERAKLPGGGAAATDEQLLWLALRAVSFAAFLDTAQLSRSDTIDRGIVSALRQAEAALRTYWHRYHAGVS